MTVLVIGASGIIGRALVQSLATQEHVKSIAASRRPEKNLPPNSIAFPIDLLKQGYTKNEDGMIEFIAIDKNTGKIGLFDCSPDFYQSGSDKVEKACEMYELFHESEDFEPQQYFINETL